MPRVALRNAPRARYGCGGAPRGDGTPQSSDATLAVGTQEEVFDGRQVEEIRALGSVDRARELERADDPCDVEERARDARNSDLVVAREVRTIEHSASMDLDARGRRRAHGEPL
jgi:hypothetical protein